MPEDLAGFVPATDQHPIPYRAWLATKPTATLLISHGMAEHAARYQPFAEFLAGYDISTWAIEHRGHGKSCPVEDRGHYSDRDGWQQVVSDLNQLKRHIHRNTSKLPLVLLGHSMGSYVALAALMAEADGYEGLLLTGSGINPRWLLGLGTAVSWLEKLRTGGRGKSTLMNAATFQSFNRRFKPNRTAFDWLSRDNAQVDKYLADPLCGFACTNRFWLDLLRGQIEFYDLQKHRIVPAHLPIRLISGAKDPVGSFGTGVRRLGHLLEAGGATTVDVDLVAGARHEVLNEVDKEETWKSIGSWIQAIAKRK